MAAKKDPTTERSEALELALRSIEKQFGNGAIMRLGDEKSTQPGVSTIPTGSVAKSLKGLYPY